MPDKNQPSPPPLPVCGIGASAGGVEALQQFFAAVPHDLGVAYVVIVHLAPDHKSELPSILARRTKMTVTQVGDHEKEQLKPNHVYVIAPDRKLEITDTAVGASAFEQPRGQRSAIDLFFRSLAQTHGDGFAVILSGTGSDGALGAKAVKGSGGLILVQDPNEAAYGEMPRAVIATGVADVVLPVRELAARLAEFARGKERIIPIVRAAEDVHQISQSEDKALKRVLDLLRKRTGHDFSKYKRSTVLRRLSRRMQLAQQLTIDDYSQFLRTNPAETDGLFDDLLISVTAFFRDTETWTALQRQVIGPLVEQMHADDQIRAWVPGCATGEEAYSLAILFHEEFERQGMRRNLMIFASDVDESALGIAREGVYLSAISSDISESRLQRYFIQEDDHYRVAPELRDCIVFATHSLMRDPPFSRLDLISCRNLLIYLDRDLQEQVMGVFRYACRDGGYLLLGASEVAADELFHPVDKKHRIYMARLRTDGARTLLPDLLAAPVERAVRLGRDNRGVNKNSAADLHLALLEAAAPPSLVVDERWNAVHLSPSASRFCQQGGGPPARRVTELVRPELRDELHALLHRAGESVEPQVSAVMPVALNGDFHHVIMLAQQRPPDDSDRRDILVTLLDMGPVKREPSASGPEPSSDLVRGLREQLRQAERHIDTVREDHYLTNEDLRAANEELQSLNEEYRSTTEELETSKEELQSINEELQTVNHELKMKIDEITRAHNDLANLMAAADVAILFLSPKLRIKRFTPQLSELFNIKSRDYDRPIGDLTHTLDYATLEDDARDVLTTQKTIERTVTTQSGHAFIVRIRPYETGTGRDGDGVVVTFVDVTALKQVERALRDSERRLEQELDVLRRLHGMTMAVATASSTDEALSHLLTSAMTLQSADFGRVQRLARDSGGLQVATHQGFDPRQFEHATEVDRDEASACARAFREHARVEVADVATDPGYAPMREIAAKAGYRAVQCTPLSGRGGELMGIISVFFKEPHTFSERDQQVADLVGQQAAALIARNAQQDALRQLNDELRERSAALEASQEELLDQDSNREEFLASLGHELRNPLSAMMSGLALIQAPDARSVRAMGVLRRQTAHMAKLIDDLLDVTRVKHGKIRLVRQTMDLAEWMPQILEGIRQQAEAKGLRLEADLPPGPLCVDGDPQRLAQVLENLLRNAVTYTNEGSVTVTARLDAPWARISIRDTGVGIDPRDIPNLFTPYRQGKGNEANGTGGLGLGLAVVKALVEAHGGGVTVRSDGRGAGSEFSVTIPLAASVPAAAARREPESLRSHRILVVDDQSDVADSLAEQLESLGQDVAVAYSAAEAIKQARAHNPQLAFVDLSMPQVSGTELARQLRKEFPPELLMLVAMTGHGQTYAVARSEAFDQSLLKPLTTQKLLQVLEGLTTDRPQAS